MTVLIDSSAWFDHFFGNRRGEAVRRILAGDEAIIISSINLMEIYAHYLKKSPGEADEKKIFLLARCQLVPADKEVVLEAARVKVRRGLSLADAIVWATAEKHGAKLVCCDSDFRGYKPLELLR
jgi:predicted nucleic acid-binding protein